MSNGNPRHEALQPMEKYWLALGCFVGQFSQLERQMQLYLMVEGKFSIETARATLSGVKIDQAKSFINRLREVHGKPKHALLDRIFAQITVLTSARNNILHYGANFERGTVAEGIVSNAMMAMPGRATTFIVSPKILGDLTADLSTILQGLGYLMIEDTAIPDDFKESFRKGAEAPWRYKPTEPAHTRQPSQKGAKKQQRQRKPSPE